MNTITQFYNENQTIVLAIVAIIIILLIAFGIYFKKTINKKTDFDQLLPLPFEIKELEDAVGGLTNITSIEGSISKVALKLNDTSLVDLDKVKSLGASGIVETKSGFTFIFGNISKTIATLIQQDLNK